MPTHIQPQPVPKQAPFQPPARHPTLDGWKASWVKSWNGYTDIALYLCAPVVFSEWKVTILFLQLIMTPFSLPPTPSILFRTESYQLSSDYSAFLLSFGSSAFSIPATTIPLLRHLLPPHFQSSSQRNSLQPSSPVAFISLRHVTVHPHNGAPEL